MTKLKRVLAGIFPQAETSAAEQFVNDTLMGVQPTWSQDVVEMLEGYRAELCNRQSDCVASCLRWLAVVVVGIALFSTVAAYIATGHVTQMLQRCRTQRLSWRRVANAPGVRRARSVLRLESQSPNHFHGFG